MFPQAPRPFAAGGTRGAVRESLDEIQPGALNRRQQTTGDASQRGDDDRESENAHTSSDIARVTAANRRDSVRISASQREAITVLPKAALRAKYLIPLAIRGTAFQTPCLIGSRRFGLESLPRSYHRGPLRFERYL